MTYQRTPGAYSPPLDLATGEFIPPRNEMTSASTTHPSGYMPLNYFIADKTETITTLTMYTGTTAAAATPTLCRMGIYSIAANGDGTLIASTPNDTALFAATYTAYPKALSASFLKVAGQRYATAFLVVSAAAMPSHFGATYIAHGLASTVHALSPQKTGRLISQADLPSTFTAASAAGYYMRSAMLLS